MCIVAFFIFVSKAQQALQEQQARARGLDLASFDVSNPMCKQRNIVLRSSKLAARRDNENGIATVVTVVVLRKGLANENLRVLQ